MTYCSIIIRSYNEEKHIGRLLDGVLQQTIKDIEIILVDSGSTDNTVNIASRYPVKTVHIQPDEFSFGRSLNFGIEQAKSDLIVIASAHVYPVYPDWLERLLVPLEDSQVALTYGKQRGNVNTKFSEQQIFVRWFPDQSNPRQQHPFCNNANAAIHRSLWEEHPYDETLSGLEDLEWARWAINRGYNIVYTADAEVIHVHNETPSGVYNRYRREAMGFKNIFPHEHFDFWDLLRLTATNIFSDCLHAASRRSFWKNLGSIVWFRCMQFCGTFQGYHHSGPLTWQLKRTFYYPGKIPMSQQNGERNIEPIPYQKAVDCNK